MITPSLPVFPKPTDIPALYQWSGLIEQREYLCNGALVPWDGPLQEVTSPICESVDGALRPRVIGHYPLLTEREALAALDAAVTAYHHGRGQWPAMSVEDRIRCVEDFAHRMVEQRDEVVRRLMWEIGKPLPDAQKEFDRTVVYIRDTVDALKDLDRTASRFVIEQGIVAQVRRAPLGVVLCMGPYNYPLNETFTTLIPALIMGNTVIVKPPKMGVLLHGPLLQAFRDAFPKGVVNTVYGDGATVVGPLMTSGQIDALAFIGSSRVADILKKQHPKPHRLRCVLGLEAKNACIVMNDADLDLAVPECVLGALSYNGQRCTALKMFFVHRDIIESFVTRVVEAVGALKAGLPWENGVFLTPLPEPGKTAWLSGLIDDALSKGANIRNPGGGSIHGTYMVPAVVSSVTPDMRLFKEEQFGPILPVATFDDIEEPLAHVIASDYGQQVSVFGRDPGTLAALVDVLVNQVCRVNVNSQCQRGPDSFPFTGRKDSAEGTLSVTDALRVFTIRTLVAAKTTPDNRRIIQSIVRERRSTFLSTDFIL